MRARYMLVIFAALALVSCGTTTPTSPPPTIPPSPTFLQAHPAEATQTAIAVSSSGAPSSAPPNAPATQTRAVELTQVAAALAPTATPSATVTRPASPVPATIARPPTGATGQALVEVRNVSNFRNSIGALYFIGEVMNKGGTDVANVQVAVSLLNDAGQVAASGNAIVVGLGILPAGEKTVWSALVQNAPQTWKEERVQAQASVATAAFRNISATGLSVEGVTVNPPANQFGSATVAGQVRNGGDSPAKFVLLTVGGYDAGGKLVLVEIGAAQLQEIPPGGTSPFSVNLLGVKDPPAKVEVYVKGNR